MYTDMGRKQTFYRTKNYERKTYGVLPLMVSIPLTSVSLVSAPDTPDPVKASPDLVVSLPRVSHMTAPLPDLETLQARLKECSLPNSWVDMTDHQVHPTIYKSRISSHHSSSSVATRIMVGVDKRLSCQGTPIELQECGTTFNLPHTIHCLNDLLALLSCLNEACICIGNHEHDFQELVDLHHGVFHDHTGNTGA